MSAPPKDPAEQHYLVAILFTLVVLGAALVSVIVLAATGRLDSTLAAVAISQLIIVIGGVAAYYTAD
jgi:hypothetical protein